VTVAVLPEPSVSAVKVHPRDLTWKTCRGSGAGGQHRNTTDSAVQLTHKPSGLAVRAEGERSQHQNKETALCILRAKLQELQKRGQTLQRNDARKGQVGKGSRADKTRTVAAQRDTVVSHLNGKRVSFRQYRRGNIEVLW
jgi:peptide chain release factor 1